MKTLEEYSNEECKELAAKIAKVVEELLPIDCGIHIVIWDNIQVLNLSNVEMIEAENVVLEFLTMKRKQRIESN